MPAIPTQENEQFLDYLRGFPLGAAVTATT
jgi:hypothetical protein